MVMQLTAIAQVGGSIPGRLIASRARRLQALLNLTLVQTLLSTNFSPPPPPPTPPTSPSPKCDIQFQGIAAPQ